MNKPRFLLALAVAMAVGQDRGGSMWVRTIAVHGSGPRIWRVVDGKVTPTPVKLLSIDLETARIAANLPAGARVVAVGSHLLEPGMEVREQAR